MSVFSETSFDDHEQVVFCHDRDSGLKAIIAIHDTTLGPALGGCRMWPYASDDEALNDVLRLSRGMTYKAAISGLDQGGGKSVIIGDPRKDKSPALFQALGRFVESLGGRYIVAEDVGITVADMDEVERITDHVAGTTAKSCGDPSPGTAWGVMHGMRAAIRHKMGKDSLEGLTVAVQGLGHVGMYLCQFLHERGVRLVVADIQKDAVAEAMKRFGARAVSTDRIMSEEADIFAPCALGAVLNDETIPRLGAPIVAGSANNQLAEDRHGEMLRDAGILYAPDYVINAGGVIIISHEGPGFDRKRAMDHVAGIYDTLIEVFTRAEKENAPTSEIADAMARERIAAARRKRHAYFPTAHDVAGHQPKGMYA